MKLLKHLAAVLCLTLFSFGAKAQTITLQGVDRDGFKKLVGEFSANSHHTTVSGASSLGEIFGFEVGVVAGVTNTPEINRLAKSADSSAEASRLPHGEIIGQLSVPFGLTVDAGFIPKVGNQDFKFNSFALGAKWTFSDLFFELPVSLAAKAQVGKSKLEFDAVPVGGPTHFSYDQTTTSLMLLVSKDLGLLEPYLALGTVSTDGKMAVSGSNLVFSDPDWAASNSASAKRDSSLLLLGTEVKLGVAKLGVEYARLYSTNGFTGKVSFYF